MKKLGMLSCVLAMLGASPALAAPARTGSAPAYASGSGLDGEVTLLGILGYNYYWANAYGLGVRYQKTLVPNVLQAQIHNDLGIEGGLDLMYSHWDYPSYWDPWANVYYTTSATYTAVSPVVGLVWNFWLNDKFALYPKLDLGYEIGSVKYDSSDPYWNTYYNTYFHAHSYGGAYLDLAGGLAVKLSTATLRAQVGLHGLYLGVGFKI